MEVVLTRIIEAYHVNHLFKYAGIKVKKKVKGDEAGKIVRRKVRGHEKR